MSFISGIWRIFFGNSSAPDSSSSSASEFASSSVKALSQASSSASVNSFESSSLAVSAASAPAALVSSSALASSSFSSSAVAEQHCVANFSSASLTSLASSSCAEAKSSLAGSNNDRMYPLSKPLESFNESRALLANFFDKLKGVRAVYFASNRSFDFAGAIDKIFKQRENTERNSLKKKQLLDLLGEYKNLWSKYPFGSNSNESADDKDNKEKDEKNEKIEALVDAFLNVSDVDFTTFQTRKEALKTAAQKEYWDTTLDFFKANDFSITELLVSWFPEEFKFSNIPVSPTDGIMVLGSRIAVVKKQKQRNEIQQRRHESSVAKICHWVSGCFCCCRSARTGEGRNNRKEINNYELDSERTSPSLKTRIKRVFSSCGDILCGAYNSAASLKNRAVSLVQRNRVRIIVFTLAAIEAITIYSIYQVGQSAGYNNCQNNASNSSNVSCDIGSSRGQNVSERVSLPRLDQIVNVTSPVVTRNSTLIAKLAHFALGPIRLFARAIF